MEDTPRSIGERPSVEVKDLPVKASRQDSRSRLTITGSRDNSITALPRVPSFTTTPGLATLMRLSPLPRPRKTQKLKATLTDTGMARLANSVGERPPKRWTSNLASSATAPKRVSFTAGQTVGMNSECADMRPRPKSMGELDGMFDSLAGPPPKDPADQPYDTDDDEPSNTDQDVDENEDSANAVYETQLSYADRTDSELTAWRERLAAEIKVVDSELKLRAVIDEVESSTADPIIKRNSRAQDLKNTEKVNPNHTDDSAATSSCWTNLKLAVVNIWDNMTGRNKKVKHIGTPTNGSKQPWPEHIRRAYSDAGMVVHSP